MAILRTSVNLRLNFKLKVTFHANIYGPLDGGNSYTTTLPLEVFMQRNFVADFI